MLSSDEAQAVTDEPELWSLLPGPFNPKLGRAQDQKFEHFPYCFLSR